MATITNKKIKATSVKQTFSSSTELDKRLNNCAKNKGLKVGSICLIALDEYLSRNNF